MQLESNHVFFFFKESSFLVEELQQAVKWKIQPGRRFCLLIYCFVCLFIQLNADANECREGRKEAKGFILCHLLIQISIHENQTGKTKTNKTNNCTVSQGKSVQDAHHGIARFPFWIRPFFYCMLLSNKKCCLALCDAECPHREINNILWIISVLVLLLRSKDRSTGVWY